MIIRNTKVANAEWFYLGTLKIAILLLLKLIVVNNAPTKTRFLPLTVASLQPFPFVIF